jgi:hypothetical protein
MKRKTIIAVLSFAGILVAGTDKLKAQDTLAVITQTLQNIYKNYDSVQYLSFDVRFDYGSDTLLGNFEAEQMNGTYTLAGKKAKYRLGDIDFMQNDSFFIAVYNKDKLILVDEPKAINLGSQLPMRQQMDSLLLAYSDHYTFSIYNQSVDTGVIQLLRADSLAQFDKFSITYDNRNQMLYQLSYEYVEPAELDSAVISAWRIATGSNTDPVQKKRFNILFLNYRFDNYDEAVYDENNYIWFENGMCKPAAKYDDFKIYYTRPATKYNEQQQ